MVLAFSYHQMNTSSSSFLCIVFLMQLTRLAQPRSMISPNDLDVKIMSFDWDTKQYYVVTAGICCTVLSLSKHKHGWRVCL